MKAWGETDGQIDNNITTVGVLRTQTHDLYTFIKWFGLVSTIL